MEHEVIFDSTKTVLKTPYEFIPMEVIVGAVRSASVACQLLGLFCLIRAANGADCADSKLFVVREGLIA